MLTGVAFVIGDLLILPYFGNWVATIADFGLAFFGIWVFGSMLSLPISLGAFSVISAFLIAIGESFFHAYMNRYILTNPYEKDEVASISQHKLQTEFSQEIDVASDLKHVRDDKE